MRVHVLLYSTANEGDQLCGVYSTAELADQAAAAMAAHYPPSRIDSIIIDERPLDAAPLFAWDPSNPPRRAVIG